VCLPQDDHCVKRFQGQDLRQRATLSVYQVKLETKGRYQFHKFPLKIIEPKPLILGAVARYEPTFKAPQPGFDVDGFQ